MSTIESLQPAPLPARNVVIGVEPARLELSEEMRPLWQQCWDECSEIKGETCAFHGERGFLIQPDVAQYRRLADANSLLVVTLRDAGKLHGYAIGILYRSPHHALVMCGNVDNFYIEPGYRSHVRSLIAKIESEFASRGVAICAWPTSPDGRLHSVLKALGYVADDVIMEKRLCA